MLPPELVSVPIPPQPLTSISPELLLIFGMAGVLLVVNVGLSVWVYRDAKSHGNDHPLAWGAATLTSGFVGGIGIAVVLILYVVVREENGSGAPSVRDSV